MPEACLAAARDARRLPEVSKGAEREFRQWGAEDPGSSRPRHHIGTRRNFLMLDASVLKTFYPLVATPCYGGAVFHNYVISIIRLIGAARDVQMPIDFHLRIGDSLVTRARNDCVAQFLSNKAYTHLFWIDADIGFSPEAALRLLRSGRDVAAGVYPLKREESPAKGLQYPVNAGDAPGPEIELHIDSDGFLKVHDAPTGFMLIRRSVFDTLIDKHPDYRYVPDWPEGTYPEGGVHYRFFDAMVDPVSRRYLSEDYAFCRLLQNIGMDIYVDANSNLTHQGQRLYTGDFGAALREAPARAIGATKGLRIKVLGLENLKPNP
jgi:hypothetical protein